MSGLLLVGCGKMGGAMLHGWLAEGTPADSVVIVEPAAALRDNWAGEGVLAVADAAGIPADFSPDTVILAVKPQMMADVLGDYRRFVSPQTLFLSIAAGTTIAFFEQMLGADAAIVRTMPNTPAAVGKGMMVACPNPHVSAAMKTSATSLLSAVGQVAWIDDEALMDAVTALSGSGPAYVFYMIEAMTQAGVAAGLPEDLAGQLALQTVYGAGELAHAADEDPATLRRNVTSPGGTTQAALEVLMADDGLAPLMQRAVAAAADRSRELGG